MILNTKVEFNGLLVEVYSMENFQNLHSDDLLKKAQLFAALNEFGKSCSCYMYLFHQNIGFCATHEVEFLFAYKKWLQKLLNLGKFAELSSFIRTALEHCRSIRVNVVVQSAEVVYNNGYILQASNILQSCRDEDHPAIEEALERLHNIMIGRWHFRMLNDKRRNLAYSLAIEKAFKAGHRSIIDIGSGTGLLSLMARRAGFEKVVSVECSEVMCQIQDEVLLANGEMEHVNVLNKMSTNLEMKGDLEERVTLIVTEIFDCGLLGEGVIPTLRHAWRHLLVEGQSDVSPRVQVIPRAAVVYGVCVECEHLRKHARYNAGSKLRFRGSKDPCDEGRQPYTTENMANIRGGYTELSYNFLIKKISFNSIQEVHDDEGDFLLEIVANRDGVLDGVLMYFELQVDSSIKISNKPGERSCWEQAIYTFEDLHHVKKGEVITLCVNQMEDCFKITLKEEISCDSNTTTFDVDRRVIARLNDAEYSNKFSQSVRAQIEELSGRKGKLNICFWPANISMIPLIVAQKGDHNIYMVDPSLTLLRFMLLVDKGLQSKVKVLKRPLMSCLKDFQGEFDLVICEPLDCNGLLRDYFIEDVTIIKSVASTASTVYIPSKLQLMAACISSEQLLRENRVVDDAVTLDFKIASLINKYMVRVHPDVDTLTLPHQTLTACFECESISLSSDITNKSDFDRLNGMSVTRDVTVMNAGKLTALVYWFDVVLDDSATLSTAPSLKSHWHQACFLFPTHDDVDVDDVLKLTISRNKNSISVKNCSLKMP